MKFGLPIALSAAVFVSAATVENAEAASFTLDFETSATGADLLTGPLLSPLGLITLYQQNAGDASIGTTAFSGFPNDLPLGTFGARFVEAGTTGDVGLDFGFDVDSITFNFGGDGGGFAASVLDAVGNVLDSISTGNLPASGLAPGPATLSGNGTAIRFFRFEDPAAGAAVDNVAISARMAPVPLPAALPMLLAGIGGLAALRRRS